MERCINYTKEGYYYPDGAESKNDLFMASEPTYRPFKSADEVMGAIKEHGLFVNCGSTPLHIITGIYPASSNNVGTLRVRANGITRDIELMLKGLCTFADGTPFGKLEE